MKKGPNYGKGKTGNLDLFKEKQVSNKIEAYILGLLYADGHNSYSDEKRSWSITIGLQANDKELLDKINVYLNGNFHYSEEIRDTGYIAKRWHLGIYNKELAGRLMNLGLIPNKTYAKTSFVFDNVPDELKWHFIRGYFDGNGCVTIKPGTKFASFEIYSKNKNFLESILVFFKKYIPTKSSVVPASGCDRICVGGRKQVKQIYSYIYQDCEELYLERKKKEFDLINVPLEREQKEKLYKGIWVEKKRGSKIYYTAYLNGKRIGTRNSIKRALDVYNQRAQELGLPTQEYKGEFIYVEEYEQYLASSQVDA